MKTLKIIVLSIILVLLVVIISFSKVDRISDEIKGSNEKYTCKINMDGKKYSFNFLGINYNKSFGDIVLTISYNKLDDTDYQDQFMIDLMLIDNKITNSNFNKLTGVYTNKEMGLIAVDEKWFMINNSNKRITILNQYTNEMEVIELW